MKGYAFITCMMVTAHCSADSLNNANIAAGIHDATQVLSQPWGWSQSWKAGGSVINIVKNNIADGKSAIQLSAKWNQDTDLQPDFPGAPGASMPLFYSEIETSGRSNLQANAIAGYVIQGGTQDAVAVSGRVERKAKNPSHQGTTQSAGFYGSAFNDSAAPGLAVGGEFVGFNHFPSTKGGDYWTFSPKEGGGATMALHLAVLDSRSPAITMIGMDADTFATGMGVWNGILMHENMFHGYSMPGTVGINMGTWDLHGHAAETAWKVGDSGQHIWANSKIGDFKINAAGGLKIYGGGAVATKPVASGEPQPVGPAGVILKAGAGSNAYQDWWIGGAMRASTFVLGSDFSYNIRTAMSAPINFWVNGLLAGRWSANGDLESTGGLIGYGKGAGSTLVQSGSKSTAVLSNKPSGRITMSSAALAPNSAACFMLNDAKISNSDVLITNIAAGATAGAYNLQVDQVNNGSARLCLRNQSAAKLAEAVGINFTIIKGAAS